MQKILIEKNMSEKNADYDPFISLNKFLLNNLIKNLKIEMFLFLHLKCLTL